MLFDAIDRVRGRIGAWQFHLPSAAQLIKTLLFVLFLAGWHALTNAPELSSHRTRIVSDEGFNVARTSPAYALSSLLEDSHWTLLHCDDTLSQCGDVSGYFAVLQHIWLDIPSDETHDSPRFRRTYKELFLAPANQPGAGQATSSIRWNRFRDEPPAWIGEEGDRTTHYLGTTRSFAVYGNMTITQLESAHQRLETVGGEDLLALLENRLDHCHSDLAYLKVLRLIASHDRLAVPVLRRALDHSCECRLYTIISLLVEIPGPESASVIRELSLLPKSRFDVYRALSLIPIREDLESVYSSITRDMAAEESQA